jgi:predicted acylesterase/phospholipase RssA
MPIPPASRILNSDIKFGSLGSIHPIIPDVKFPKVAIVLSGGGAKGSFEVGAVRYLYNQGVRPDILCGTSVGALNAAKLAEGEGGPAQGLAGLENIWLNLLKRNSDMYVEGPWLSGLDNAVKKQLPPFIIPPNPDPVPGVHVVYSDVSPKQGMALSGKAWGPAAGATWLTYYLVQAGLNNVIGQIVQSFLDQSPRSLYDTRPIGTLLSQNLKLDLVQQWAAAGGKLRLATVGLESGRVRYVTETGELLERDNRTVPAGLPFVDDPVCQGFLDQYNALGAQFAALGAEPSADDPAHDEWQTSYDALVAISNDLDKKLNDCRKAHPPTARIDLKLGVMASAAMPTFFLPVKLGPENYVDGGIRDVMPVAMAAQLGAHYIFAINDSKGDPLTADTGSYDNSSFLEVALRSLASISQDEILHEARTGVPNSDAVQVTRIDASFEGPYDHLTIHPALIRMNMSYGYMRASDVVSPAPVRPDRSFQLSDDITQLRRLLFQLEVRVNNPDVAEQLVSVPMLRWGKGLLKLLVDERSQLGGEMPPDLQNEAFLFGWEIHMWTPAAASPFHAIGPVPAHPIPGDFIPVNGTLLREENSTAIFLILAGAKFMIPWTLAPNLNQAASSAELTALGLQAAPINAVPVGSTNLLPGIPREGTLIQERLSPDVFLIQNGTKRLVTGSVASHGLNPASVLTAPTMSVASIPTGGPL